MQELQAFLEEAMTWPELQFNRTAEFELMKLQVEVQRHMIQVEHLDEIIMLRRQIELMNGDQSWFTAYRLSREFEDIKLSIGRGVSTSETSGMKKQRKGKGRGV